MHVSEQHMFKRSVLKPGEQLRGHTIKKNEVNIDWQHVNSVQTALDN